MELKIKTVNTMTGSDGSQYGKFTIEPLEKKEDQDFFYMVLPVRMNE